MKTAIKYLKNVLPLEIGFMVMWWAAITGKPIQWIDEWCGDSVVRNVIALIVAIAVFVIVSVLLCRSELKKAEDKESEVE